MEGDAVRIEKDLAFEAKRTLPISALSLLLSPVRPATSFGILENRCIVKPFGFFGCKRECALSMRSRAGDCSGPLVTRSIEFGRGGQAPRAHLFRVIMLGILHVAA